MLALFAVTVSGALLEVSAKVAVVASPDVLAVAVRLPAAVGLTVTDASPFDPVVALALEKESPEPLKLTTAPGSGLPLASLTIATRGFVNPVP
jgi:hypothetical protein